MRYFLELAFNGSSFHGWQVQPNAISVQSTLETALSTILRHPIDLVGAGRTDAGVHAYKMFAHFDSPVSILNPEKFLLAINSMVGKNIFVKKLIEVDSEAHARFDATLRTYKYFIGFKKNPFLKELFWHSPSSLDMEVMNDAASLLLANSDFTSFAKLHSDAKTNICKVTKAEWKCINDDVQAYSFLGELNNGISFTISADRFLRNMVRSIVGTLVDVGRHKITKEDFQNIINFKNRGCAGTSMPAHALFLWDIEYPFISKNHK